MLSGNTFADYFYLLNTGLRFRVLTGDNNDNGGVHSNSLIWSNALWSIRTRLAQIDGVSGNESDLATDFDKIVYAALTTQLGPTSGFLDARNAVEQTIQAADADPTILRVARELFDENLLCADCNPPSNALGQVVVSTPQTQLAPTVSGDDVAWVDLSADGRSPASRPSSMIGGEPASRSGDSLYVAYAGTSLISLELPDLNGAGQVAFYPESGDRQVLGCFGQATVNAGSPAPTTARPGPTRSTGRRTSSTRRATVSQLDLQAAGISSVTAVGTGDGQVALGTDSGQVFLWNPADDSVTEVGHHARRDLRDLDRSRPRAGPRRQPGRPAVRRPRRQHPADRERGALRLGAQRRLRHLAGGRGCRSAVAWPRTDGRGTVDTDLYLYSLKTGTIYNLLDERGQQAFPAVSGDRLVWQDAVFGGDDIMTAVLPPGL